MADGKISYKLILKALIAVFAAVGVTASIVGFVSCYAYKREIRDILNNEYRPSCTVFLDSFSDKAVGEDTYIALEETQAALDRIAAVEVPYSDMEAEIDKLVAEEKMFISDLCRCCELAYSGRQFTAAEKEWLEQFIEMMREENKLYSFYKDMNALLSQ